MMTQQLRFSVLTAPVAAMDRRALSQAWYSALHLARPSPKRDENAPARAEQTCATVKTVAHDERTATRARASQLLQVHQQEKRTGKDAQVFERRSMRSPLARKIEHLFLRPNVTAKRATFTIDGTNARVQVSMQQTRCGLRLVAVCPSHARHSVARALEQVRYALAARGIAIDARIAE